MFSTLIDFKNVKENNADAVQGSNAYRHLFAACLVANEVRLVIKQTCTHPFANSYDKETWDALGEKIDQTRAEYDAACRGEKNKQQILDITAASVEKEQVGDCPEYAMLALKKLQTAFPNMAGEIFAIENKKGDVDRDAHEFVVIGRDPNSDPNDFTSWGNDAVICDAWAGNVYTVAHILIYLKGCHSWRDAHDKQINSLVKFDPEKHKLVLDFTLESLNKRKEPSVKTPSFFQPESVEKKEEDDKPLFKKQRLMVINQL